MHRNKEIILHFSIQILFIKFKSPRFVRIRAFFLPLSQVNKPTNFRRSDEAEEFGPVWVCLGQKGPIDGPKHRFNPLNPINTHFLTKIPPHPLSHILRKSSHRFNRFSKTNRNGMLLVPPVDLQTYYSLTCWLVDSLTFKKNRCKNPQQP